MACRTATWTARIVSRRSLIPVMHQLQEAGTFGDIGKLRSLVDMAHEDVVLSRAQGGNEFSRLSALAGSDVEFRTLPVVRRERQRSGT